MLEDKNEVGLLFAEGEIERTEKKAGGTEELKPRLKRINRDQMMLRPVNVEDLVGEDDEVRAIWELVGRLDLSRYYKDIRAVEGTAGREASDPQLMISLWVYAYKSGVSSAREISRLCEYHPAYQWLTGLKPINYHTLSDFRVEHKEALDELFTELLGLLSLEGLVTLERVMHDGTKIKANAGGDSFRREERLQSHLKMAREHVAAMGDPREAQEVGPRVAAARRRAAREKQGRLELALEELEKIRAAKERKHEEAGARASQTDPESRMMKQGDGGYAPSYNVQISTDAKVGAIVGVGLSQSPSDSGELPASMNQVEKRCGQDVNQAVADGGYTNRATILEMDRQGIDFIGSIQEEGNSNSVAASLKLRGIDPAFGPHAFVYESETDTYRCPAGKCLSYEGKENHIGKTDYRYRADPQDCQSCPLKMKCCPQTFTKGRAAVRGVEDPVVVAFRERMQSEEAKQIYKQRAPVAEFPNAWIKDKFKLRQFRVRGLGKAEMEALWAGLTYNIQLWIRLKWRPQWECAKV